MAKYHGIPPGAERKPRRRPSSGTQTRRRSPAKRKAGDPNISSTRETKIQSQQLRVRKRSAPLYKDPLASCKLEMIKNIRAERTVAETKKIEAIERAR